MDFMSQALARLAAHVEGREPTSERLTGGVDRVEPAPVRRTA